MSCPACFSGSVDQGETIGSETIIANMDVYVTSQEADAKNAKKDVVIVITDVFGWRLPNVRLIADQMAAKLKMRIYVPDLHDGWSPPSWLLDGWLDPAPTFWGQVWQWARLLIRVPQVIYWIATRGDRAVVPRLRRLLTELRDEHGVGRVVCSGYCWGARYAVLLGGTELVTAFAATHPSDVHVRDLERVCRPGLFIVPDKDPAFPPALLDKARTILNGKAPPLAFQFHEFPGMLHGFAVRGRSSVPEVREARATALSLLCDFVRHALA